MRRLSYIIDNINERVGKFVSFWMIFLIGVVMYEVVMRYIFNNPTIWAHETSMYIYGAMFVLAGGHTLYHKGMVNMDVIYGRFSVKGRAILDLCTFIFAFICLAVLVWKSWVTGWNSLMFLERSETVWRAPLYPARLVLPVGAFLILIQLISKFIKDLLIATGRNGSER